mmetsp:Transcript_30599/g.30084  ORF Transcript_30599/g.30084 Transcript_30599/m.30084 type:complete len:243 (-) Transcript_30599:36-764(-)
MGHCLTKGMIKKVPVITEEYERLPEEAKEDPLKLFKAINDPNNAKGSYFYKMKAFFDDEKNNDKNLKKKNVDVKFESRQIKDLEAPFASYPMPNLKSMKIEKQVKPKFVSLPPMNENYRPQRKQYSPREVKQYMTSTIDLSQPDFTFCKIKNIEKHSEYVKMMQLYASDKKFQEKYGKQRKPRKLGKSSSQPDLQLSKTDKNVFVRNSMLILPHLNAKNASILAEGGKKMVRNQTQGIKINL